MNWQCIVCVWFHNYGCGLPLRHSETADFNNVLLGIEIREVTFCIAYIYILILVLLALISNFISFLIVFVPACYNETRRTVIDSRV
jgi:hypothetical protein